MKKIISIFIVLGGLVFLFGSGIIPENFQPQEILNIAKDKDVIIIFNSGGWGDTPFEKAKDFAPIIEGIQQTLNEWGYNSIVIPYNRTRDNLTGELTGIKDFFSFFDYSSEILAEDLEFLAEKLPDKKIIIAGLSNGATFVNKTMERVSKETKGSVYAIAAGTPFWAETLKSDNVLQLDNNGKDSLVKGDAKPLLSALFKAPLKWIFSKIKGGNLTLSQAFYAPGHDYSWSSPEVGSQIVNFLEKNFH